MAAMAQRSGPRGSTGKWGDKGHSSSSAYEGLEVSVEIERLGEVFQVSVSAKPYDDATAGDFCYVCCCTNNRDGCTIL
jgi:hypothetical protein